ncbi:hypothetical protein COCOBI_06-2110 [Coccomyxa sp. Obi]|nr:hypothetical protein COCOBI_06-2110 [Coccomyxa sp. Obi]
MRSAGGAAVVLLALFLIQAASARDLQQVALPSAFPGADTGEDTSTPAAPAATTPSPTPAASTSPAAAKSPAASSPAAAKAPTASAPAPGPKAAAPVPAPAAGAPSAGAPAPGPAAALVAPAPGPAAVAKAGAPAPAAAAIATGGGDAAAAAAANGTTMVVYIQQAGNVQMSASPSDPQAGTMFMNNALDTTLYDQDYPVRKLGKTSTTNFINAAVPANESQWFAPAPQAVLLGFNTTFNVYMLLTLSAPVYNFTTNTLAFSYLITDPAKAANSANISFVANYYINANDSGVLPVTSVNSQLTLFTPSLFYSIPCNTTDATVPIGSCTTVKQSACLGAPQGVWRAGVFCA